MTMRERIAAGKLECLADISKNIPLANGSKCGVLSPIKYGI